MKTVTSVVALCIVFSSVTLKAQLKASPYEVGFNFGTSLYTGDLTPGILSSYKSPGLFFGIEGRKILNQRFTVRTSLSHGKIKANDANYATPAWRKERNFNFQASVTEIAGNLIYYPLGAERKLTPYVFAGVGYSFLKITRDYSNFNENYFAGEPKTLAGLSEDLNTDPPKGAFVLPVGAGIRYPISKKLSLNMETSYKLTRTDYLDGFSKAANPKHKDAYYTHTVGIIYTFGSKSMMDCPTK